jgi:hypothetical protein
VAKRDRSSWARSLVAESNIGASIAPTAVECSRSSSLLRGAHSSTRPSFRAPASSDSGTTIAFAQLVQHHDPLIVSERGVLRDCFTLLVGTDSSLMFSRLGRFLLEPFLAHSVFGRVFERMERGMMTATVTFEA